MDALERVLRLPAVGSKRFLTTKVDRCVTGLVAQQQCVGPLQLPLADVAVTAQTHFGLTGIATSIGEQPYKVLMRSLLTLRPLEGCTCMRACVQVLGSRDEPKPYTCVCDAGIAPQFGPACSSASAPLKHSVLHRRVY